MPLNPKGTMFPFNGDISGVVAAVGDAGVGACLVPVSCAASFSGPSPAPFPKASSALFTDRGQINVSLI